MALNPPIEALGNQQTDRVGHLQRYLSGLPDFGSWQEDEINGQAGEVERTGMNVKKEREVEAAKRRNERKLRRRDKAAILKPEPPPEEKQELDQEWWDNYRAQKQAPPSENRGMEVEKAQMTMEKKENRRIQSRIPRAKGRGGRGGVPGIEIIEAYKPMTTALGPRMTMKPEKGKKGMFANGKSSAPGVIELLESTKAPNLRISSSQSASGKRLTLESPEQDKGDWRDQWRRKSSQSQSKSRPLPDSSQLLRSYGRLPDPGYTGSTSWRSMLPSGDGPSKPSHSQAGGQEMVYQQSVNRSIQRSPDRGDRLDRYMYDHPSKSQRSIKRDSPDIRHEVPNPHYPHSSNHSYNPQESQPYRHQDPRLILFNRDIWMKQHQTDEYHNQGRTHQPQEAYDTYPQMYSHQIPSHPSPSSCHNHHPPYHSSSYPQPNSIHDPYADHNKYSPQTPPYQESREIPNMNARMNIPPPSSNSGPSRPPERHHAHSRNYDLRSTTYLSRRNGDEDRLDEKMSNDPLRERELEGFFTPTMRPSHMEAHVPGRDMEIDHSDRNFVHHNYREESCMTSNPIPPSPFNAPQSFHPGDTNHFIGNEVEYPVYANPTHWSYEFQHDIQPRNKSRHPQIPGYPSRLQANITPQIHHANLYLGSEVRHRYQTPLPIPISNCEPLESPAAFLRDLEVAAEGVDLEEGEKDGEIVEFGASRDEWKSLWSSRKILR